MTGAAYQKIRAGLEEALEITRSRIAGDILAPDAIRAWRIPARRYPYAPIFGSALCPHYGAVALWVGRPDRRLMGFVIAHLERVDAALDEMAREAQELGLY